MRIALVHSFYRSDQPSGENLVVEHQAKLLRAAGHDVLVLGAKTDELAKRPLYKMRSAWNVAVGTGINPTPALERFKPDVVHVHNLFPNLATRWLASWPGPLVATLHNYRPLCASATLERQGATCTTCPDGHPLAGVRFGCYSNSRLATLPLALRNQGGVAANPLLRRAGLLIVLSDTARGIYAQYGAPEAKLRLIPNGVAATIAESQTGGQDRWAVIGRLSPEKKVVNLVADWPSETPLDVIGDGPDLAQLVAMTRPPVQLLGRLPREQVLRRLRNYTALVFPGTNLEGAYPLAAVETMAAGVPLVAAAGGAAARLVERFDCGTTYNDRASLATALVASKTNRTGWGAAGQLAWASHFTPERWLEGLLGTYRDAGAT